MSIDEKNKLREDYGLGARKGHYNVPYLLNEKMKEVVNEAYRWYDELDIEEKFKTADMFELEKTGVNIND